MLKSVSILILGFLYIFPAYSQKPKTYTASEIHQAVQKLNFLGTALYLAAHPDDENTQMISYLSNEVKARTAYLSITRGDGGQNLIGSELREILGVVRTEELLAARDIDGGEQFFTRANDFGYSKHPDETLKIWNKKEVLSDVIWVIRNFKPDVIINRFDHRSPGTTHGHHTASALLSMEAFEQASDPALYKEQLKYTDPWQPKKLFFNTSWWFYGSPEKFQQADKSNMLSVDVGTFYPSLGKSNNEIASLARSQHLSQGFGTLTSRGSSMEYLELLKGDMQGTKIFDGINTRWTRVKGGAQIEKILLPIEKNFNFSNPAAHIPQLLKAYKLVKDLDDPYWRNLKSKQLKEIIAACSGLFIETTTDMAAAVPGTPIEIKASLLNRSPIAMKLSRITIEPDSTRYNFNKKLGNNHLETIDLEYEIPENSPISNPYWLNKPSSLGMYQAPLTLRGKARTPPTIAAELTLVIDGTAIDFKTAVVYKFAKPDKGERYQPFEVLPKITVNPADKVMLFADDQEKQLSLSITSNMNGIQGTVAIDAPQGWEVSPQEQAITMANKGEVKTLTFSIIPPKGEDQGSITPVVRIGDDRYTKSLSTIAYDHIPTQSVLMDAKVKVVRSNIKRDGKHIAYVTGAGDAVPESLEQIGYQVNRIQAEDLSAQLLKDYDAVVMGIRAYNVNEILKFKQPILFDYVKNGGNLIVQYNTVSRNSKGPSNLAPYPLELSRKRVTDENATVNFIAPDHPLLNSPNKITAADFEDWVQERGLYFADTWSKEFIPVLSMNDAGENPKLGSLLVTSYGKGYYIYTGLSFFRELPAGVGGAYKLLANMLSIGKQDNTNINALNN